MIIISYAIICFHNLRSQKKFAYAAKVGYNNFVAISILILSLHFTQQKKPKLGHLDFFRFKITGGYQEK